MEKIKLSDPEKIIKLSRMPFMPWVLLKGIGLSILRPSIDSPKNIQFNKFTGLRNNISLDSDKIMHFNKICNPCKTSETFKEHVPMVFFQSLFIGLLGKYIVSPFFPLIPMGLIHTKQQIVQKRKIYQNEILNAKLMLDQVNFNSKGFEIICKLELTSKQELVWEGLSTFLSKNKNYRKRTLTKKKNQLLPIISNIDIPDNIGREYARVSGDCNPHHLSNLFARMFGFKHAIAHGMWSLARTVQEIENQFIENEILSIDVSFKKPLFLPGKAVVGAVRHGNNIEFELRNHLNKTLYLAGTLKTTCQKIITDL